MCAKNVNVTILAPLRPRELRTVLTPVMMMLLHVVHVIANVPTIIVLLWMLSTGLGSHHWLSGMMANGKVTKSTASARQYMRMAVCMWADGMRDTEMARDAWTTLTARGTAGYGTVPTGTARARIQTATERLWWASGIVAKRKCGGCSLLEILNLLLL